MPRERNRVLVKRVGGELNAVALKEVKEKLREFLGPSGEGETRVVSAPGRADFLNTHQDYKGLPVVPVAVRLRCYCAGTLNTTDEVRFASLNLKEQSEDFRDEFRLDNIELRGGGWFGDYARAVFASFSQAIRRVKGIDIALWSEVPIGSGLSSSASLELSIVTLISSFLGLELSKTEMAEIAYRAEHDIVGIPCGRLDQYASVYGGVIKLETRPPFKVEQLTARDLIFAIAYSGEQRRITSIHPIRQEEINKALRLLMDEVRVPEQLARKLGYTYYGPQWENITEEEISPYLASLPRRLADRILFTIKMQASTTCALELLGEAEAHTGGSPQIPNATNSSRDRLAALGAVMNYQHELLRDLYEVSTPRLEELRSKLLQSGALGAKISGAGLGGSIIALVRDYSVGEKAKKACIASGFPSVWVSTPDEGARVEDAANQ
jgi:galactokinase